MFGKWRPYNGPQLWCCWSPDSFRTCPAMDSNLQRVVPWWIIVFNTVCTLTESRVVYGSPQGPAGVHINVQAQLTAVKQPQRSAGPGEPSPAVAVKCHPGSMEVVVQAEACERGCRLDGRYLRLGFHSGSEGSGCAAVPSGEAEFIVHAQLSDCGTKLSSTKDKIIYSNVVVYSPEPSPEGVLRLDGATVPVECHYEKKYSVDGISLHPSWIPFVSMASADDQIDFHLLLMTEDWQVERGSSTYFLGDPIHFEVSANMGDHVPLRVYVDHCVATATPDADAALRYDFIERHGCLADAHLTNSNSRFLPRVEEHKLRFHLEAFRFYKEPSNQVYITCSVKAVPVTLAVSSQNKACSLIENRWQSVDGNDQACRSCDMSHLAEEHLSTEAPKTTTSTKAQPTMSSRQSLVQHLPATYFRFSPRMHHSRHRSPRQSLAKSMQKGTDYKAEQSIRLGPLVVLPSSKVVTRPTDSTTVLSLTNKTTGDSISDWKVLRI